MQKCDKFHKTRVNVVKDKYICIGVITFGYRCLHWYRESALWTATNMHCVTSEEKESLDVIGEELLIKKDTIFVSHIDAK